jgi:hypothetical protein
MQVARADRAARAASDRGTSISPTFDWLNRVRGIPKLDLKKIWEERFRRESAHGLRGTLSDLPTASSL